MERDDNTAVVDGEADRSFRFAVAAEAFSDQVLQILEADSQALHWRKVARVALYVEMFYAVLFCCCEDSFPVDCAGAYFREVLRGGVFHLRCGESRLAILQV